MIPLPKKDLIAAMVVLIATAGELIIREMYYRMSAEIPALLMVVSVWGVVMSAALISSRWFSPRATQGLGRIAVIIAVAVWLHVVGRATIASIVDSSMGAMVMLWAAYSALALGALVVLHVLDSHWALIRRTACAATFLFVACQPIVAAVRAPVLSWPERGAHVAPSANADGKAVTLFLLLDELNARSAAPIVDELSKAGRGVRFKELVPIGNATHTVIPSMFTGKRFAEAKPCGISTVCSGSYVLDFSKIIASRPDVDVVGFYEPYCAMPGLRYCARLSPSSPNFDSQRWWCAALRRSIWLASVAGKDAGTRCANLGGQVWERLVSRIEDAIWLAPVWRDGGFLYIHFPLPHPPGEHGEGSLTAHYQTNLERAVRLVAHIVKEVNNHPTQRFTIVVFSDHPLRADLWCGSTQYRHNGCPLQSQLIDDKVPLIVAGDAPAAFDQVQSNMDIFRLTGR